MRSLFAIVSVLVAVSGLVVAQSKGGPTPAVVVELFTSEGCSSCPPADALLVELSHQSIPGVQVIPLGVHVDYWNQLGWKDRFSSHQFTVRQNEYARQFGLDSVYTPQIVVEGTQELVGSEQGEVRSRILRASRAPMPAAVSLELFDGHDLNVDVSGASTDAAQVWLAVTEDALATNVSAGENAGVQLHHAAVVRDLRLLGRTAGGSFRTRVPVALRPEWRPENVHLVVFVQRVGGGILGAATFQPATSRARR